MAGVWGLPRASERLAAAGDDAAKEEMHAHAHHARRPTLPRSLKDPEKRKHGNVWHPRPPLSHSKQASSLLPLFETDDDGTHDWGRATFPRLLLFLTTCRLPKMPVAPVRTLNHGSLHTLIERTGRK